MHAWYGSDDFSTLVDRLLYVNDIWTVIALVVDMGLYCIMSLKLLFKLGETRGIRWPPKSQSAQSLLSILSALDLDSGTVSQCPLNQQGRYILYTTLFIVK